MFDLNPHLWMKNVVYRQAPKVVYDRCACCSFSPSTTTSQPRRDNIALRDHFLSSHFGPVIERYLESVELGLKQEGFDLALLYHWACASELRPSGNREEFRTERESFLKLCQDLGPDRQGDADGCFRPERGHFPKLDHHLRRMIRKKAMFSEYCSFSPRKSVASLENSSEKSPSIVSRRLSQLVQSLI